MAHSKKNKLHLNIEDLEVLPESKYVPKMEISNASKMENKNA